jgi:hypothetical protein
MGVNGCVYGLSIWRSVGQLDSRNAPFVQVGTYNGHALVSGSDDGRAVRFRPTRRRATAEVTGEVERLLRAMDGEMSRRQIQEALALKHEDHFRNAYLKPALTLGVIADPARQTTQ